jgi:hypothetical protein
VGQYTRQKARSASRYESSIASSVSGDTAAWYPQAQIVAPNNMGLEHMGQFIVDVAKV